MSAFVLRDWLYSCLDDQAALVPTNTPRLAGSQPWCRFGIRDPSLVTDSDGRPVIDPNGRLTLFFNGRDKPLSQGGTTCVGVAHGSPHDGWVPRSDPVFLDGPYTAQGSVLRLSPDHWRMYYRAATPEGFHVASSVDGVQWQRSIPDYLLRPEQFSLKGMGRPFVVKVDGIWIMLFEGFNSARFHLYMASSKDGLRWSPENTGNPIYLPPLGQWDSIGQVNPSLYRTTDSSGQQIFFIFYNGYADAKASNIGILTSKGLNGPWQARPDPLLTHGEEREWDRDRIQGPRLAYIEGGTPSVVFFSLPGEDSYGGGRIAAAELRLQGQSSRQPRFAVARTSTAEEAYNDKLAESYFRIWDHYPIQCFTTEVESRLLDAHVGERASVLVLGSGGGRELPVLLAKQCRLAAIDISSAMLAAGRTRYTGKPISWIQADMNALPTANASFDAAVCLGAVFNYLPDPDLCLRNIFSSLRRGGQLFLAVLNAAHASEPHARLDLPDGRVRRLYRMEELLCLLEKAGFAVADTVGIRFLVDLLPVDWNRNPATSPVGREILENVLSEESRLSLLMGAEKARFIFIRAYSGHRRNQAENQASY